MAEKSEFAEMMRSPEKKLELAGQIMSAEGGNFAGILFFDKKGEDLKAAKEALKKTREDFDAILDEDLKKATPDQRKEVKAFVERARAIIDKKLVPAAEGKRTLQEGELDNDIAELTGMKDERKKADDKKEMMLKKFEQFKELERLNEIGNIRDLFKKGSVPAVPDAVRNDPAVKTAVIAAAAEDLKFMALEKGLAEKYKNEPEITTASQGEKDSATRLYLDGRVVRVSEDDAKLFNAAQDDRIKASDKARKAVSTVAAASGITDEVKTNGITQELINDTRKTMEPKAQVQTGMGAKGSARGF